MARVPVPEWLDQPWWPTLWRNLETEFLDSLQQLLGTGEALAGCAQELLMRSGMDTLVEMGAGTGAASRLLQKALHRKGLAAAVVVTDLWPNVPAMRHNQLRASGPFRVVEEPVDAGAVPAHLTGLRLVFNTFHHFPPALAQRVLADAQAQRQPIMVVELVERRALSVLTALLTPLLMLAISPLIRPWRWSRLAFTYLLPVLPLAVLWNGFASCMRVYSPVEMHALAGAPTPGYRWESRRLAVPLLPTLRLNVFTGCPL